MTGPTAPSVPELDLTDPAVVRDPFTAYGAARERSPIARALIPGMAPLWVVTRHADARALLGDDRFEINAASFLPPDVPADYRPYLRTMTERPGPEHARLRRLVAPAFTARRAAAFGPRIEPLAAALLDGLPGDGPVDLLEHFARPLPMDVICALVGIPDEDRPAWRAYGATVTTGGGQGFADAVPGIIDGAREAVARRRAEPADDLLSDLVRVQAEDGDRLTDTELVTLVWHLVMAGQTPTHLIANSLAALLPDPGALAALRTDPSLMPNAVEEFLRLCGPNLLTVPRYARTDVDLHGVRIAEGEAVSVSIAAANRDPRVWPDPDAFDPARAPAGHLAFAHGAHFCLGASLARVQTAVALTAVLERFPDLAPAADPAALRVPDPGTWRLSSLPVHRR